ncbi:MAG: hypothetical protein DMF68_17935 [Acidobacteria bacterium]|nr:MAG: hypothetical protein DMF68_17935 [Acidobacteriota bacterium]
MAKDETKRLTPAVLTEDEEVYAAVKDMGDYAPANPAYTHAALDTAHAELKAAFDKSVQADAAAAAARDDFVAMQWRFHNLILGTKDQVTAQYGPDSNQVQSIKRKKKSEYNAPKRKSKTSGAK